MANTFKKFDVKHGLSVNGLTFVDENRNVTLNNLTVQGTSTVIDTRTLTTVDPIISLGKSGSTYTVTEVTAASPGRLAFAAEDLSDFAVGDSVELSVSAGGTPPGGLAVNTVYYVKAIDTDVSSATYGTLTVSATQGGAEIAIGDTGNGTFELTLNPLQELGQDLGIEVNYVDSTAKTAFFGFDDSTKRFTYIQDASYAGSAIASDVSSPSPAFSGTKGAADFSALMLQHSSAITSSSAGLQLTQTWNGSGNTFDAIEIGITDTASASTSKLIQAQVGGNDKFLVRKDGVISANTSAFDGVLNLNHVSNSGNTSQPDVVSIIKGEATWDRSTIDFVALDINVTQTDYQSSGSKLASIYASGDRSLEVNAEGEIISKAELKNGTHTALLVQAKDAGSDAASLLLDLQTDSASQFSVTKAGAVTLNSLTVVGTGSFQDEITVKAQTNSTGNYADATNLASEVVTIQAQSTAPKVLDSVTAGTYTTYEYLIQAKQASNGYIHSTKILLVQDGSDIFMTEYGTVYSNDILVTFDADHNSGNFRLLATKTAAAVDANNIVTVKVTRTAVTA